MDEFSGYTGFEWDEGNFDKNWIGHRVTPEECEEVFANRPPVVGQVVSGSEPRYHVLGETDAGRRLFLVFTVRGDLLRVISARDMSRRERQAFERDEDETSTEI